MKRHIAAIGVPSVYGAVAALSLTPVFQAAATTGEPLTALLGVAGGVGGNLIAEQLQRALDRGADQTQLATQLVEGAATNEALRDELNQLFARLDVLGQAQRSDLSQEDRAWLLEALRLEMQQIQRGQVKVEANVIQWGRRNTYVDSIVGSENVHVGDNHYHYTISAPGPASVAAQARETYLRQLAAQCDTLPLVQLGEEPDAQQPRLRDVYIALNTTTRVKLEEAEARQRRLPGLDERALTALEAAQQNNRLVLLGDPGSGKRSFVYHLVAELAEAALNQTPYRSWPAGTLPVIVTLRALAPRLAEIAWTGSTQAKGAAVLGALWDLWRSDLADLHAPDFEAGLQEMLTSHEVLMVLDGLDEVPVHLRDRVRWAVGSIQRKYNPLQMIVTCRIRSYNERWLPGFERVTLAPFTPEQSANFVTGWYSQQQQLKRLTPSKAKAQADDLRSAIRRENDQSLAEMAENPLLLTQMMILHQRRTRLPRERVKVYDEMVKLLIQRWQEHKGIDISAEMSQFLAGEETRLRRILEQLAYAAHSAEAEGNEGKLERRELLDLLSRPNMLGSSRLVDDFLDYVDIRAGVLVGEGGYHAQDRTPEEDRPARYYFPHRTFQEYLAGCDIMRGLDRESKVRKHAAEGDFWQVAVQLGSEELYHGGYGDHVLYLAKTLCPPDEPNTAGQWRAVLCPGQITVLIGRDVIEQDEASQNTAFLERRVERLLRIMRGSTLPAIERAEAGRVLAALGDPRDEVMTVEGMQFCWVPEGRFWMGEGDESHQVSLPGYWIALYPVTNAQYEAFVEGDGYETARYWGEAGRSGRKRRGVVSRCQSRRFVGHYRMVLNRHQPLPCSAMPCQSEAIRGATTPTRSVPTAMKPTLVLPVPWAVSAAERDRTVCKS